MTDPERAALVAKAHNPNKHGYGRPQLLDLILRLADALEAPDSAVTSLFDAIAHGDEVHRAWLKRAIDDHFAGRPVKRPESAPSPDPGLEALRGFAKRMSIRRDGVGDLAREALAQSPDPSPPAAKVEGDTNSPAQDPCTALNVEGSADAGGSAPTHPRSVSRAGLVEAARALGEDAFYNAPATTYATINALADELERLSSPTYTDAQIERAVAAFYGYGDWIELKSENVPPKRRAEIRDAAMRSALAALLAEGGETPDAE